jgi:hypothetical protein
LFVPDSKETKYYLLERGAYGVAGAAFGSFVGLMHGGGGFDSGSMPTGWYARNLGGSLANPSTWLR